MISAHAHINNNLYCGPTVQPCRVTTRVTVTKSRKWKKNDRNIILFRCSKALYFHTFSKIFLSKFTLKNIYNTPQICSGMLKIAPKALHFLKFLAILVVYFLCIGVTNIVDCFIIIFKYLKEISSIIIKNIFQNIPNKKVTKKLLNNLSDYTQTHSQGLRGLQLIYTRS